MHDALATLAPATPAEAASMLRENAAAGSRMAFVGGGTHTIGTPATDAVRLSTGGLNRIIEYAPEDQTITVEAGVTVAQLAQALAARRQRLVLDVAEPQRATVGGAIAANAYGPRRLRVGSLKDLILGVSLVRADGTPARAGGKVVKNVAGFDLSKLLVGSHGTLALITAATLRVHPLPERTRAIRVARLPLAHVWQLVIEMRERQLEPAAISALRAPNGKTGYDVDVIFEGFAAGVDAQSDTLAILCAARQWTTEALEPDAAQAADTRVRAAGPLRVRYTTLPSAFAATDTAFVEPLAATLDGALAGAYPSLGIFTLAGTPTAATATALAAARAGIERSGGSLVVERQSMHDGALEYEPWGTPPPSFGLMRQIKSRFDPAGRLASGRFIGGL